MSNNIPSNTAQAPTTGTTGGADPVSGEFEKIRQLQQQDTIRDMWMKYMEEKQNRQTQTLMTMQDNKAKINSDIIQSMKIK